jgi:hypothetical protein
MTCAQIWLVPSSLSSIFLRESSCLCLVSLCLDDAAPAAVVWRTLGTAPVFGPSKDDVVAKACSLDEDGGGRGGTELLLPELVEGCGSDALTCSSTELLNMGFGSSLLMPSPPPGSTEMSMAASSSSPAASSSPGGGGAKSMSLPSLSEDRLLLDKKQRVTKDVRFCY